MYCILIVLPSGSETNSFVEVRSPVSGNCFFVMRRVIDHFHHCSSLKSFLRLLFCEYAFSSICRTSCYRVKIYLSKDSSDSLSILKPFLILFTIFSPFLCYLPLKTGSFFSTNALVAFL